MYALYKSHKKRKAQKAGTAEACEHGNTGPCQECKEAKSAVRKYRWKMLLCLTPAFFVASLDLTIVASSLPFIASHFDKLGQLNWIVTAYTLADATFIPAFGQLADVFGRHNTLQLSAAILTIGSALCAAAQDWPMLLLGRGLQGLGTAGVQNVVMIVLADKVSLREQAVNTSIFQLLNGVGYSVGPVIGGYLTSASWRYIFVLGTAMSAFSMFTIFLLRKDLVKGSSTSIIDGLKKLDYGGMFLFIFGAGLLILGVTWGGATYPWSSASVIAPLVIGSVMFVSFFGYEYVMRHHHPMLPFEVLKHKDVALVGYISASTGAALFSVFYFIGLYFTVVEGYSSDKAGVQLLYYVPGLGAGVYFAMFVCNVWPRQTFFPIALGSVVEVVAIGILTFGAGRQNATLVNAMMVVAGAGTGMRFMPCNLHLAGLFRDQIAAVYSVLRFSMPFGGTIGLAIVGSVFQNKMAPYFGSNMGKLSSPTSNGGTPTHSSPAASASASGNQLALISTLPKPEQDAIHAAGANAIKWAFTSLVPILALSALFAFMLGNVWINVKHAQGASAAERGEGDAQPVAAAESGDEKAAATAEVQAPDAAQVQKSEALDSFFLIDLLTGQLNSKKRLTVA